MPHSNTFMENAWIMYRKKFEDANHTCTVVGAPTKQHVSVEQPIVRYNYVSKRRYPNVG